MIEFLEMTAKRSCIKSEKKWAKDGTLRYMHKKDLRKMKWNFGWRLPENVI